MRCDCPTIAVRRAGINPASGVGYKPHLFVKWERFKDDGKFVDEFFRLKRDFERPGKLSTWVREDYLLPQVDPFGAPRLHSEGHVEEIAVDKLCEVFLVGCGKCPLCIKRRKKEWATRCVHEAQMSNGGVFLTLTCSDDSIDKTFPGRSLRYEPFQDFMKRLRKGTSKYQMVRTSDQPIRFFMCGEYGEEKGRPHYHAALFGCDFPDKFVQRYTDDGQPLFDSPFLIELRNPNGEEVFGPVSNFASITPYDLCYTCGYVDKKLYKDETEYIRRGLAPEFVNMSRRPGIGGAWIDKYFGDTWHFYADTLLDEGVWSAGYVNFVPRYYFSRSKITRRLSETQCDIITSHRRSGASEVSSDPAKLLASLKEGHAKAVVERKRLQQVLRRF